MSVKDTTSLDVPSRGLPATGIVVTPGGPNASTTSLDFPSRGLPALPLEDYVSPFSRSITSTISHTESLSRAGSTFGRSVSSSISHTSSAAGHDLISTKAISSSIANTVTVSGVGTTPGASKSISSSIAHTASITEAGSVYLRGIASSISHTEALARLATTLRSIASSIAHTASMVWALAKSSSDSYAVSRVTSAQIIGIQSSDTISFTLIEDVPVRDFTYSEPISGGIVDAVGDREFGVNEFIPVSRVGEGISLHADQTSDDTIEVVLDELYNFGYNFITNVLIRHENAISIANNDSGTGISIVLIPNLSQIDDILSGTRGNVLEYFDMYRVDITGVRLEKISQKLESGSINVNRANPISRTGTIRIKDLNNFDLKNNYFLPVYVLGVNGLLLEYEQGIYQGSYATRSHNEKESPYDITISDLTVLLTREFPFPFTLTKGSNYIEGVRSILSLSKMNSITQFDVTPTTLVTPADFTWEKGTPYIVAMNDLLQGINYLPAYVSKTGKLKSRPRLLLADRPNDVFYGNSFGDVKVVLEPFDESQNQSSDVPNETVVQVNDPLRTPFASTYYNDNSNSPSSLPPRYAITGFTETDYYHAPTLLASNILSMQPASTHEGAFSVRTRVFYDPAVIGATPGDYIVCGMADSQAQFSWHLGIDDGGQTFFRVATVSGGANSEIASIAAVPGWNDIVGVFNSGLLSPTDQSSTSTSTPSDPTYTAVNILDPNGQPNAITFSSGYPSNVQQYTGNALSGGTIGINANSGYLSIQAVGVTGSTEQSVSFVSNLGSVRGGDTLLIDFDRFVVATPQAVNNTVSFSVQILAKDATGNILTDWSYQDSPRVADSDWTHVSALSPVLPDRAVRIVLVVDVVLTAISPQNAEFRIDNIHVSTANQSTNSTPTELIVGGGFESGAPITPIADVTGAWYWYKTGWDNATDTVTVGYDSAQAKSGTQSLRIHETITGITLPSTPSVAWLKIAEAHVVQWVPVTPGGRYKVDCSYYIKELNPYANLSIEARWYSASFVRGVPAWTVTEVRATNTGFQDLSFITLSAPSDAAFMSVQFKVALNADVVNLGNVVYSWEDPSDVYIDDVSVTAYDRTATQTGGGSNQEANGTLQLYINNVLVNSANISPATVYPGPSEMKIGFTPGYGTGHSSTPAAFPCPIHDVALYYEALSAQDVTDLHNDMYPVNVPHCMGYWKRDGVDIFPMADDSAHGFTMFNVGSNLSAFNASLPIGIYAGLNHDHAQAVVDVLNYPRMLDQATADQAARLYAEDNASNYQVATLNTGLDPRRDLHEVYTVSLTDANGEEVTDRRYAVDSWAMDLATGGKMTHTVRRVEVF